MASRLTLDEYFMMMLRLVASRSTCVRREVGAIITDEKGRILSTGYNGVPSGVDHCTDIPCIGATDEPGNTSNCFAVHAEQNALLQCHRLDLAHTLYASCTPCFVCAKLIANTGIKRVVVAKYYSDTRGLDIFRLRDITHEVFHFIKPQETAEQMKTTGELSMRLFMAEEAKPMGKIDDEGNLINKDEILAARERLKSAESRARDMLTRMGYDASDKTTGDLVELANLINGQR